MKFSMSWSLRRKVSGSPKLEVSLWLFPFLLLQNIEFASSLSCRSYLDRYSALRRVPRSSSSIVFKAKKVRQKKSSIVFLKSTSNDNNDNFELWQVGNVEQDLHNLEVALMYLNADENGYHDERMEALDSFAQSRYPVATQLRRFILQPLIWSFAAAFTLRRFRLAVGKFLQFSRLFSIVYFWAISVIAPTSLLLFLNFRRKGKYGNHTSSEQDSDDSCFSDVSYMTKPTKFGSGTRDARLSSCTNDYVQCLLEQWASCILGGAVAALSWLAVSFVKPIEFRVNCVLLIQMITRWGIIASLRQYPPLWFALNRKQQPRPLNWPVWTTQQLIRIQRFTFCSAIDGTLLALSYPSISPCYVSSITLTAALWFCILQSEKWINSNERNSKNADSSLRSTRRRIFEESLYQAERMTRYVSFTALFLWMWYHAPSLFDFAQRVLERLSTKRLSSIFGMSRFYVAATTVLCVGLLVPGLHIAALCKLFHVSFMHDASLNMNIDLFRQSILADSKEFSWRWRCRLKWREPQRIPVVLGRWWERFWYWLFLEGSVDEKLQKESQRLLRGDTSVKSRGLHVLQRVETDPSTSYSGLDRTQWKTNAMEMIARKHQFDYERGSFDDPLGVAVYRTLGIGLGFNSDHMSKLNDTDVPSIRRLQSRAAKSAIKRVNELYRNTTATSELDQITDPIERQKRASLLNQDLENEIKYLADRLASLVPNDLSCDETDVAVDLFNFDTPKRSPGSKKYSYIIPSLQTQSPALQRLFDESRASYNQTAESYEIDYLDPMGTNETSLDDEFIAEWYRQNRASKTIDGVNRDDQETLQDTFFV